MSNRYQEKDQQEQLHREIKQVRGTLESYRPLNQEQRAELARTTRRLVHAAYDIGDCEAWREALDLDGRVLAIVYPGGFWESYERLKAGETAELELASCVPGR